MAKARSKLFIYLLLLHAFALKGQENTQSTALLIPFVQELETRFDIKFSYADADLNLVQIKIPEAQRLADILADIKNQTQLQIRKLNDRYYTISQKDKITICGVVLDNFKQNTVTGAVVRILETNQTVTTDTTGYFTLEDVSKNAKIQIKHLGFKTRIINAKQLVTTPCPTLLLSQFYQQLEEVVVYEFLTKGLVKQFDASIEMNTAKFGILPGLIEPDVLQTVQALPGIKSIDETVSDINIRGGSNDQNLILWDGIKMYQSGHFFGLISAFNPYLTDKVTLIKNGTSAKYGDGVSGIIDMRTTNELSKTISGGAGFNLINADVFGQVPLGNKVALHFSGRRSLTDFLNTTTFETFFTKAFLNDQIKDGLANTVDVERDDRFYFYDFTAKALYDINDKQKLRFSFIKINNFLDYNETQTLTNTQTKSELDQNNYSFGGSLESNWTKKFATSLNTYFSNYDLDAKNTAADGQQIFFQSNRVTEKSLRLNTHFKFNADLHWLNGYQLTETNITNETNLTQPPFESNVSDIIKTHAFFSELGYVSPDQKIHTNAGIRLNYYDNPDTFTEFVIEPRLNINYAFTRELKALLLGEFKSQVTNQVLDLEQNFLGIEKRRWILSDGENLPVTKSKQISIGLNYDQKNLFLGIEGFYKQVKGISTTTQGFQNQNQFSGEIGQYEIKGVELLVNKKTEHYSLWASYTYNLNDYTFNGVIPPNFPNNFDIRHTATAAGTLILNNFKIGLGLNYRTGKPFTQPNAADPIDTSFFPARINYEEPNSSRLTEYLRADASAVYDFNISSTVKASTGISVLNFTNRANILNTFYRVNNQNTVETVESFSLGVTPNFSFRVNF